MEQETALQMTTGGWTFMAIAWTAIIALVTYCYYRVLRKDSKKTTEETESTESD